MQIKRGAYHIFDPGIGTHRQIRNYLGAVEQAGGFEDDCIPPILNASNFQYKSKIPSLDKKIRQCLDDMKSSTGQTPIIHISRSSWSLLKDRRGNYPNWANDYLLWIPWYPSDPDIYKCPPINTFPSGWEDWVIWTYDEFASISGIKGYVSLSTLSESYAMQIGLTNENKTPTNSKHKKLKFEATIVATEGAIVRRRSLITSKMLAFLAQGSKLIGESIEFANTHEAWLQVTKPVIGWCPIVHTGRTYLSISDRN
jgi:GH25 family lysozyme M1 (1,4-beta-N-acetylmuramidase)